MTALCPAGLPTTTASVRGIYAQGLAGRVTSVSPGEAAVAALDAVVAGRAICVPGLANRGLYRLANLVSPTVTARVIGRRWLRARRDVFRVAEDALEAAA